MFLSLLLKRLSICLVCHRIIKMNKRFAEFFAFAVKRELDENFLTFFEEKIRNDLVIL